MKLMEKAKLLVDLWSLHLRGVFKAAVEESLVFCSCHFLLNVTHCWLLHSMSPPPHLISFLAELAGLACVLANGVGSPCELSSKISHTFNKNKSGLLVLLGLCGMAG